MKRAVAVCGAVAMLMVAASAFAQANFSGKWAPDADKNPAPAAAGAGGGGGRGGGAPAPMTITATATEFTIERETPNGAQKQSYKLDGTEQTVTMGQGEAKVKASFKDGAVTIVTTRDGQNGPTTTTAVYSMEGANLVVANTRPGRNGGEPTTTKVYYKKQ